MPLQMKAALTVTDALKIPEVQHLLMAAQYCLRYHSHDSALPGALAPFLEAERNACTKCGGFGREWGDDGKRNQECTGCHGTGERQ
jgi:hypothetical protein